MKKILLSSALLFLLAITGFSQEVKPVQIDSLVSVSLPAGYNKKDTLGQQIFTANSNFGYVVVLRSPNAKDTPPLQKERDLNKLLKDNVASIKAESSNASTQAIRDTTIGTLKAKTFTLRTDDGQGDAQLRDFIILYTTAATYTFDYTYPESRKEFVKKEYTSFVNSIKLSPQLQRNDQYLSNAKGISPVLEIGVIGGGAVLILIIGVMYIQKKRRLELE